MSILTPCELDFGLMKSTTVKTYLMTNDTSGCLRTDSMYKLIPVYLARKACLCTSSFVVSCIDADVLTI